MDHAPALSGIKASVPADQAVFTSIRSPMGEGYRIVAASAGVTADERKELTQRSPSHGSLCDHSEDARALASFTLRSGRQCLAMSRHAGVEHTARGGQRVYTHIVLLTSEGFERFFMNPLLVRAEVQRQLGEQLVLEQSARLEPVELSTAAVVQDAPAACGPAEADRLLYVLGAVLGEQRVALTNVQDAPATLEWLFQALPLAARRGLSLSVGLKYSPGRDYDILIMGGDNVDLQRLQNDEDRLLHDWAQTPPARPWPHGPWLDFVKRLWACGRILDVDHIARRLSAASPAAVEQIVRLCGDFEVVASADVDTLIRLVNRHAMEQPTMPVHEDLLQQFRAAAEDRHDLLLRDRELLEAQSHQPQACDPPKP